VTGGRRPGGHVGASLPRREDARFLRGEGAYVADLVGARLHLAFVRSTVASGRIRRIDLATARAAPGVVEVLDGAALARLTGPLQQIYRLNPEFGAATGLSIAAFPVDAIAVERVRYVGEPVAVVVATDRYRAEDGAELVRVAYDELPSVLDVEAALLDGSPLVRDDVPGNLAASLEIARATMPADGAVVVEGRYLMGRHSGVPMETRGVVADVDDAGRVHLTTSTQIPHLVQRAVCLATGWEPERLRVSLPDVGGGFGTKANYYVEELVACVLAAHLRAGVAWIEDRAEHMVATAHSRDRLHTNRLVLDRDGRIQGYSSDCLLDIGAYNFWVGGSTANSAIHGLGPYRIPASRLTARAVLTNKTHTTQYRGAGRPEAVFALERLLDQAAGRLGLDPLDLRRRNLLGAADLPYELGATYHDGQPIVYDGGDYQVLLERCVEEVESIDLSRHALGEDEVTGVGYAMFTEGTGIGPFESARVSLLADGTFAVYTGAASAGMSHETTFAQVAADQLAATLDEVEVRRTDTDQIATGLGSMASRSAANAGSAVHEAAGLLVHEARAVIARDHDIADPRDVVLDPSGRFLTPGGVELTWAELAAGLADQGDAETRVLDVQHDFRPRTVTWTAGAHAVVVAVDLVSGFVRVLDYVAVDEGGVSINPMVVHGQVQGGMAQAVGGALYERFGFDAGGQPLNSTLMDYLLPVAIDVPRARIVHVEQPSRMNPLGVKGVGESGTIPGYAAIAAAIDQATGCTHLDTTPFAPDVIADAVGAHRSGAAEGGS
jgi:aerobic carbon-monoxide dehydrogenase large subunit